MTRDRAIQLMLAIEMGLLVTGRDSDLFPGWIYKIGEEDVSRDVGWLFDRRLVASLAVGPIVRWDRLKLVIDFVVT